MARENSANSKMMSIVSNGIMVIGDIVSDYSIKVDGAVEGNIEIKGDLLLGPEGKIKGEVKAQNIVLSGKLEGSAEASNRFEITSSGCMIGEVISKVISIKEGGLLQGRSKMSDANMQLFEEDEDVKQLVLYEDVTSASANTAL